VNKINRKRQKEVSIQRKCSKEHAHIFAAPYEGIASGRRTAGKREHKGHAKREEQPNLVCIKSHNNPKGRQNRREREQTSERKHLPQKRKKEKPSSVSRPQEQGKKNREPRCAPRRPKELERDFLVSHREGKVSIKAIHQLTGNRGEKIKSGRRKACTPLHYEKAPYRSCTKKRGKQGRQSKNFNFLWSRWLGKKPPAKKKEAHIKLKTNSSSGQSTPKNKGGEGNLN